MKNIEEYEKALHEYRENSLIPNIDGVNSIALCTIAACLCELCDHLGLYEEDEDDNN